MREEALSLFLRPGFERYLPDEFEHGQVVVDDLVQDFVAFRMFVEAETRERVPKSHNRHGATTSTNSSSRLLVNTRSSVNVMTERRNTTPKE